MIAMSRRPCCWAGALLLIALGTASCGEAEEEAAAPPPPAVSVLVVEQKDVTPATEFVGRVVAADKVELRARVQGFLQQRLFTEGQDVAAGDTLFRIEPEPFEAAVKQAQADVASAEADAHNAQLQLDRAEQLVKRQTVAVATRDDRAADLAMARARVQDSQAALDVAQINLTYTEIKAPLAGRIGLSTYSEGNLVGPDSGTLATIVSQDPIYVTFPVSQREILAAQRRMAAEGSDTSALVVRLKLPDGSDYPEVGKVNFLGIQVDPGTDTATVRAAFANPDRLLTDGAFVNVSIERGTPTPALLIPQAALQIDQAGPFALVVTADNTVEVRRLTLGATIGSEMIVQQGLSAGDRVIVDGIQKVRPGLAVQPTEVPSPTAAPAAGSVGGSG
ncbi:efflux RND transporter periplasmic adaptor subunit [Pelagibius sp. 7325]|uniref:efflux RND transporter periplasmic adaptor subunit n=1 Tax=Pelagibius sp. 7325 TaxID=3131994 RepID=UPI0030EF6852